MSDRFSFNPETGVLTFKVESTEITLTHADAGKLRHRWREALEEGEYEQGHNRLHMPSTKTPGDEAHCCLGVAKILFQDYMKEKGVEVEVPNWIWKAWKDSISETLNNTLWAWFSWKTSLPAQGFFMQANDNQNYTFPQIAFVVRSLGR